MIRPPFAIYRLPFADECTVISQLSGKMETYAEISELEGKSGFVMIPFTSGGEKRIVLIRPDKSCNVPVADITCYSVNLPDGMADLPAYGKDEYAEVFSKFHDVLCSGQFDKLVLSRYSIRHFEGDVMTAFKRACETYPRMMVYLCSAPECGTWIGCTPEILLSGSKTHYRTVALAGTVPLPEAGSDYQWSEKNKREQRIVAEYVRHTLHPLASVIEEEGPYNSRAGQLLHLKTHFHFSPRQGAGLTEIVNALHPTPAVCGMPKAESRRFIGENEGYARGYYSGIVGMLAPDGKTDLYVNLRCASVMKGQAVLYAGGGLLESSEMETEWMETEEKMKTIGNIL